jgi:beta-galactosidase
VLNKLPIPVALIAAHLLLAFSLPAPAQQPDAISYRFINATHGKFAADQCFWSLDNGRTWHSFAKEPTVACPKGNGRVYFALGKLPKNFDDREAHWDFIEYAFDKGTWHGNTTQVDAFCIPITIELGEKKAGSAESRRKLFEAFRKGAPKEFQACVKGDFWILSPCRAGFDRDGPNGKYFDKYIDENWGHYSIEKKTPSGKWMGKVTNGALIFTPVDGGKSIKCERKPITQEAFLGSGILATNPQFCAAINRHVLADPADWNDPEAFYKAEPYNWYAKFFHEHGIDKKAYGFCYDDVSEQAAFFSGKGKEVVVTVRWDE